MEQSISLDKGIKKGASVKTLAGNDSISIIQNLGSQFGVNVTILQKEGERYTSDYTDRKTGESKTYRGLVPQGKSYISIKSQKNDMHDFWEAVRAEEASQKNSSNPPKI